MARMDDGENQPKESQETETNDAVVPAIDMGTLRRVSVADGTSTLNLELTMNVSPNGGHGENLTEDPKTQHDGLLLLAVQLLEKIDAQTVALEDRMSALERPTYQTGKSVTEIHSLLTTQGASPTSAAAIPSTDTTTKPADGYPDIEPNIIGQRQSITAVSKDIGSPAEQLKSLEKGKGLAMSTVIPSLDIIVPNSPGFDDDVIIDEALAEYWCSGVLKRTTHSGIITLNSVDGVCEKPDCRKLATTQQNSQANVNVSSIGVGSAFKPYGMMNGFQMVFRPTVHMDLTLDECKMAAYIFGKNDQYLEMLFKFSTLEVPRVGFHSLSPVYMPNVDIMNIILMSASMRACCVLPPRVWYTPSVFADDVIAMRPFEVIRRKYMNRWMPATSRLEHVLVPVCEKTYTWYLMVVDVKHERVYCLDVTRAPEHKERRERNMRTILLLLAQFFMLESNMLSFSHVSADPTTWGPIKYPDGVPSYQECDDSCLWILNWIQTEGKFKVSNLPWQHMDPLKLRMKTATKIVLLDCNEVRATVVSKADAVWRKVIRMKD
ncbi:hypothetical protein HN873_004992 [Arachis hypogaea]